METWLGGDEIDDDCDRDDDDSRSEMALPSVSSMSRERDSTNSFFFLSESVSRNALYEIDCTRTLFQPLQW